MESRNLIPFYPRHPLTRDPLEAPQAQKVGLLRKPQKRSRNASARCHSSIQKSGFRKGIHRVDLGIDQVLGRFEYPENRYSFVGRKDSPSSQEKSVSTLLWTSEVVGSKISPNSKAEEKRHTIVRYPSTEATVGH